MPRLKEPKRFGAIAHQHILGLLVMVEHHLVVLTPNARFLVAAEGRMRRIEVVAIGPYSSRLDAAAHAIGTIDVAGPHARAETVKRFVGDLKRVGLVLEGGHREHGALSRYRRLVAENVAGNKLHAAADAAAQVRNEAARSSLKCGLRSR
jgi:hypothetical protein